MVGRARSPAIQHGCMADDDGSIVLEPEAAKVC